MTEKKYTKEERRTEFASVGDTNEIKISVQSTERKWYHKILGINKKRPITGLIVSDFEVKKTEITCVEDWGNGEYLITVCSDIDIITK